MNENIDDFDEKTFNSTNYLLRGRLFRTKAFDIIDPSDNIVLQAKPPAIISSGMSIFTRQGKEIVACQNKISFKDAYISGVYRYEFKDIPTNQIIGGLKGIRNKTSQEGVEWQILDPQMMEIGRIEQEATPPNVRYGDKPMNDIITGFIGNEKVCLFKVNINSFRFEILADFSMDGSGMLDRKVGVALAVLFASIKRTKETS